MTDPHASPDRRLDLDWLRIAAFGILIFYHVGMFYVTWDWHVKSSRASPAIEPLMMLVNPWRLTLLFIISGVATRFMADKMRAGRLFVSRMGRLWPPLILAVFVIVPPQSYFELVEQIAYKGSYLDFYPRYATASGQGWCDADGCLVTPTYNHMWFVAYLIAYTLLLIGLLPLLRRAPKALEALIAGPGLFLTPWLFMVALRLTLAPIFGQTHAIWDDWYLHPLYFGAFLFGFAVARHEPFFAACQRWRFVALALALASYAYLQGARAIFDGAPPPWAGPAWQAAHELQAWTAIVAAFGFAHRHLRNADTPLRRYLTEAIFPFYLVHQTIIIVAGHYLDDLGLPLALEVGVLIGLTAAGCYATYEIARRSGPLRPWFGLRP